MVGVASYSAHPNSDVTALVTNNPNNQTIQTKQTIQAWPEFSPVFFKLGSGEKFDSFFSPSDLKVESMQPEFWTFRSSPADRIKPMDRD